MGAREESARRWSGDGFQELSRSLREVLEEAHGRADEGDLETALSSLVQVGTGRFGVFVDGGDNQNSRLTFTVPGPGLYVVWVRAFGSGYGTYHLEVTAGR